MAAIERRRLAIVLGRGVRALQRFEDDSEIVMKLGHPAVTRNGALDQFDRSLAAAHLMAEDTEIVERVRMVGSDTEDTAIGVFGRRELSCLVIAESSGQRSGNLLGRQACRCRAGSSFASGPLSTAIFPLHGGGSPVRAGFCTQ